MVEIIVTSVLGIISSIVAFFLAKKKYNSEVKGNDIKNMQDALTFYKDLTDDSKGRLNQTLDENEGLQEKVDLLTKQVHKLTLQVEALTDAKNERDELVKENTTLKLENRTLKLQIERYKEEVDKKTPRRRKKDSVD
jgi:predicted RNase H-like nuclease (RuvC/YqgF family)